MNSAVIALLISILYMALKTIVYYKECPVPNLKEGILVFFSSLGGLYLVDQMGPLKPKVTEVFTETPTF